MIAQTDATILNACKALFGPDTCVSPAFLFSLKPNTIKSAFRKKAKETHPDLFSAHDSASQRRQAELFRVVNEAYEIMWRYCQRRDRAQLRAVHRASNPVPPRTPAGTRSFSVDEHGWLFRGRVPERWLEIGRYLYYRGCIPYHVLIKALAWQMRQRPPMGAIAKRWGWLNDHGLRAILSHRGQPCLFGERALQLGLLSSYQTRILLAYQRTLHKRIGRYFVERGHLTQDEVDRMVSDLGRHNARFPFRSAAVP